MSHIGLKKLTLALFAGCLALTCIAIVGLYAYAGSYGLHVLMRRGGSLWLHVKPDDARLSLPIHMALRFEDDVPPASVGTYSWKEIRAGFEIAEVPVLVSHIEVDRLMLARVDPDRFRFVVRVSPAGDKGLDDWMRILDAALVINGSYFSRYGFPDTPIVSAGMKLGPERYDARHGALISSNGRAAIVDLSRDDWRSALVGADDAMVSYPLLVADGTPRVKARSRWLANRSFVGQDSSGKILLGTTAEAYFSLDRLAEFLTQADLDLVTALNLDGGPVACQAVSVGAYHRDFCGSWELTTDGPNVSLLTSIIGDRRWALPIVLAVLPK